MGQCSWTHSSFEEDSQNVANKSLRCKDDIQGKTIELKDVAKMTINVFYFMNFPVKIHSFEVETTFLVETI